MNKNRHNLIYFQYIMFLPLHDNKLDNKVFPNLIDLDY